MQFDFLNRLKDFVGEEIAEAGKERILKQYADGKSLDEIIPVGLREYCIDELVGVVKERDYSRTQLLGFMERRRDWLYKKGVCVEPNFDEEKKAARESRGFFIPSLEPEIMDTPCSYDIVYNALHKVYRKVEARDLERSEGEIRRAVNRLSIESELEDRRALAEIEGDRYGG